MATPQSSAVGTSLAPRAAPPPQSTPVPVHASWKCEVAPHEGAVALDGLTVGAKFELKCSGSEVVGFNTKLFSLELVNSDKFRLRILENKQPTSSGVDLVVTSYVPGETSLKDAVLTDGTYRIGLDGISFALKSVIKQDEKEPPKPFPPEGPVGLMWPTSTLISLALVFGLILISIIAVVQKRRGRLKFLKWLEANRTPLSPFDQLNKDLRKALKERNPSAQLAELELATQTYLSRLYKAPLLTRSTRLILKVIGGKDRKRRAKLSPITVRLFGEFERVSESVNKSQVNGAEALNVVLPQMHDLIREFAEKVQAEFNKQRDRP